MTEFTSAQELFKGRHLDQEIILLCVRWYLTFKLSTRDLVQMMTERGITTAQRFDQVLQIPHRATCRCGSSAWQCCNFAGVV